MRTITIITFIYGLFANYSTEELPKCDEKDILVFAECLPLVNELKAVTKKYQDSKKSPEAVEEMADVCDKTEECLGPVKCKEAAQLKALMEATCSRLHYINDDRQKCVTEFFKDVVLAQYSNATSCLKEYGFLEENSSKRKKAYTEGKACFLNQIKKLCTNTAYDYFTRNFNKFVKHVSNKPETKDCKSPYHDFNSIRCAQMSLEVGRRLLDISKFRLKPDDPVVPGILKMCRDVNVNLLEGLLCISWCSASRGIGRKLQASGRPRILKMCRDVKICVEDPCDAGYNLFRDEVLENCKLLEATSSLRRAANGEL